MEIIDYIKETVFKPKEDSHTIFQNILQKVNVFKKKASDKKLSSKSSIDEKVSLATLEDEKIFSTIPKYKNRKRIFGIENEYGVINPCFDKLPKHNFIENGGRIYEDCGHIEYASPETSNPLEAVVYGKAGELIAQKFADKLYKNNVDSRGNTFGAHENYFTKANDLELEKIIPFLVTRQIFAGAGKLNRDGSYDISQKSLVIETSISSGTTSGRGILCTKNESLSRVYGWRRLHLILGDANMSEVALFLKLGTTGLVLDLVEDNLLPKIGYDRGRAVNDLYSIARKNKEWMLRGVFDKRNSHKKSRAVTIQNGYLKAAKKHYQGRDEITDLVLDIWGTTLNKLNKDPMQLVGALDWVTKKALIDSYAKKHKLKSTDPLLRNIDLQYHDVNRKTSLFYALQRAGKIKRLFTDNLIKKATIEPPKDTRAYLRGNLVKEFSKKKKFKSYPCWDSYEIYSSKKTSSSKLCDPFNNYDPELREIKKKFNLEKRVTSNHKKINSNYKNIKETPFKIRYHHRYDLRDWLVENFPFVEKSSLTYGKGESRIVKDRASEIVDASRQVEEIDLRAKSSYVDYYNEDWVRIKSAYEKKDYVEMARALKTLKDAIDVE